MNVVPGRGARIILAMLPFILIAIIYVIGVGGAARRQS
jgi:NitT/TauT family transport system permease protein